jgi:hypothetical protein
MRSLPGLKGQGINSLLIDERKQTMTIRSRAAGLLAGSALALGTVFGMTAQDAGITTAVLAENTGACFAFIDDHEFGVFRWGNEGYTGTMIGHFSIGTNQEVSPLDTACEFSISGSDLTHSNELIPDVIAASEIMLIEGVDPVGPLNPGSNFMVTIPSDPLGFNHTVEYDISGAIHEQTPGVYGGTVTVTSVATEPGAEE